MTTVCDESIGLPDKIENEDHLRVGSNFVMAGDSLLHVTDDNETNHIVFSITPEDTDDEDFYNDAGEASVWNVAEGQFETWTADDLHAKLVEQDNWYHWRLLNRQIRTYTIDGGPVTFAFYTMAVETPWIRENHPGKAAMAFMWDAYDGVEGLDAPPEVSNTCLYESLSKLGVEALNPTHSEQITGLAEWYDCHSEVKNVVETLLISTDHNARVRMEVEEPRLYREENVVDAAAIE